MSTKTHKQTPPSNAAIENETKIINVFEVRFKRLYVDVLDFVRGVLMLIIIFDKIHTVCWLRFIA